MLLGAVHDLFDEAYASLSILILIVLATVTVIFFGKQLMLFRLHIRTFEQVLTAFDDLDHVKERNLICRSSQLISAVHPRHRADDSVLPQFGHDFGEVAL